MTLDERDGFTVMGMHEIEIWDGADLSLLRDTMTKLFEVEKRRAIGVDMTYVKYIPSGFFGMLFDWQEKGAAIRLYSPQPHVKNMLWFRQFFAHVRDSCHELLSEPKQSMTPSVPSHHKAAPPWKTDENTNAVLPSTSKQAQQAVRT